MFLTNTAITGMLTSTIMPSGNQLDPGSECEHPEERADPAGALGALNEVLLRAVREGVFLRPPRNPTARSGRYPPVSVV